MGSSAVSKRSGKHCVLVHDIRRGSQYIVGWFQIIFSFGRIPFVWVPAEWKKRNYMTYLLGINIVACAWRLFLHVKVNIILSDRRWAYRSMFSCQIVIWRFVHVSCQISTIFEVLRFGLQLHNHPKYNNYSISKLFNTSFVIWSGQCIMLRNTALL